tara:strand:- start:14005 stop:14943 length:939 start_codon:yes stop_codon:yes gene_type:complete
MNIFKVGITGASGLIGKKLCAHFVSKGFGVSCLTRNAKNLEKDEKIKIFETDLSSPNLEIIKKFTSDLDILFHLASELKVESKMISTNYLGTKLIVNEIINKKTTIIYMSSIGVFDFSSNKVITESSNKKQSNQYEKTKFQCEQYLFKLQREGRIKFIILRPSIILDYDMKSKIIDKLISLSKNRIKINVPRAIISNFVLAENVITALIKLSQNKKAIGQSFNISSDIPLSDFLKLIRKILEKKWYLPISMNNFLSLIKLKSYLTKMRNLKPVVSFFSNTCSISNQKIESYFDTKINSDYLKFLTIYIQQKK